MSCDYCIEPATHKVWIHYMCEEHYNEYAQDLIIDRDNFEYEGEYVDV